MNPKILTLDIETAPIEAYVWGIHDQNIGISQIKKDWHLLGFGAKWFNDPASKLIYLDNRKNRKVEDDRNLITAMWKLLDEADIVVTQNGDKFDFKKFNARAVMQGHQPPSFYRSTDVLKECRKVFGFTSQTLEYTADIVNNEYKKLHHPKFPGMELWKQCLAGNEEARNAMKEYCSHDVLATEEKLKKIWAWIKTPNLAVYYEDTTVRCICGSKNIYKKGFVYTNSGKYQGYKCKDCSKRPHGRINLLSTEKKKNLLKEGK